MSSKNVDFEVWRREMGGNSKLGRHSPRLWFLFVLERWRFLQNGPSFIKYSRNKRVAGILNLHLYFWCNVMRRCLRCLVSTFWNTLEIKVMKIYWLVLEMTSLNGFRTLIDCTIIWKSKCLEWMLLISGIAIAITDITYIDLTITFAQVWMGVRGFIFATLQEH